MAKGKHRAARLVATQASVGEIDKRLASAKIRREEATKQIHQFHTEREQEQMASIDVNDLRNALVADQALMERVRQAGIRLTVGMEQIAAPTNDPRKIQEAVNRMKNSPLRYTAAMSRPSGLPITRDIMLANMGYEKVAGMGAKPLEFDQPRKWQMFFATADFASLFAEMQRDFTTELVDDYVNDIMEEWGPNGQIVVGFDLARLPVVRVSKTYGDSTAWADLKPDLSVYSVEGDEHEDRMNLGAMGFQWRTNEYGTSLFAQLRSAGDTFRTTAVGSPTTRDAVLIVWMLASRQLRMLESTVQRAQAGLPPRVKGKRKIREDLVTVVSLRRHVKEQVQAVQFAPTGRQLQHRFVVRGHWRNQAYGSNRALRRRTYILPYVKGPEGAPFVEREKVYQW